MQNAADFYGRVAAQNSQNDVARNQALSDDFRKQKIADTMAASNNLHKSIALLLDPDTMQPLPGKEDQVAQLRGQLDQLDGYVKNLYNPNFDPQKGAITESPLHKLGDLLHITKPPAQPYTDYAGAPQQQSVTLPETPFTAATPVKKTVGQQLSDLKDITARFGAAPPENPFATRKRQLEQVGFTPDKVKQSLEVAANVEPKPAVDKPTKYQPNLTETTDAQGNKHYWRVPLEEGGKPEEVDFQGQAVTPKTSLRPKSQYDQQKEEFAKSLGKTVDQLTWPEEQEFIKKRNPLGTAHLGIAYELLKVSQANQELKSNENDFKSFMALQKDMGPFERVQTAATNAQNYVNNPSASGDVALVFAFIEATKPSSGFRFTETERKWIVGTRGIVDAAMTRINQGFTGETLAPEQRQQIANIIQAAGKQAQQGANKLLQGAGQFNPKAAAAAGGQAVNNQGGTNNAGGKTKGTRSLKQAMALDFNKGKSEAEVRADLEKHGYKVAP